MGIDNKKKLEEGATEFLPTAQGAPWFSPQTWFAKAISRLFASKAQPYIAQQSNPTGAPLAPLAGDTVVKADVIRPTMPPVNPWVNERQVPHIPELEYARKKRYREYEDMDGYPEISSSFDIYADESTQLDIEGNKWTVHSDSQLVREEANDLFETVKLERSYWDIVRNTVKYGDCFVESVIDTANPKAGIQRLKVLNPFFMYRVENEYGYLTDFLQEIPDKEDWASFGYNMEIMKSNKFIPLDKNQIIHFRLYSTDPAHYPYGKSIAAAAIRVYRMLKMMEDAMLIYRLERAPERRVFYIDVGNLPATKADGFLKSFVQKFKKQKYYDAATGNINERFNPLGVTEDFFIPVRGDNKGTKVETLQGAENLGEVDDVKYFRDKLLACLKIPKDYVVEKDKSPERKANLAQLDVKFARTIQRVQRDLQVGFTTLLRRHLALKGFPQSLINAVKVELPDPSDMFTKRKLDVDEQKARVVQAVLGIGLFSRDYVYDKYYNLTEYEKEKIQEQLEQEQEKEMEKQMKLAAAGGGMDPNAPPGGPGMAGPNPAQEAGGQEPAENVPPTSNEQTLLVLEKKLLLEQKLDQAVIIKKMLRKLKNSSK